MVLRSWNLDKFKCMDVWLDYLVELELKDYCDVMILRVDGLPLNDNIDLIHGNML